MARGTTFLALVGHLRTRLGRASDVSVGVGDIDELKQAINDAYEHLYHEYDWPHLRRTWRVALAAGQYRYDLPDGLDLERIEEVRVLRDSVFDPICSGITFDDYTIYDPEEDERNDPVQKWDIRNDGSDTQIEVWPVPASNDQEIVFQGFQEAPHLVADSDTCLLDDVMVVLFAATALLERQGSKDADTVKSLAVARLNRMKGRLAPPKRVKIGLGSSESRRLTVVVRAPGA